MITSSGALKAIHRWGDLLVQEARLSNGEASNQQQTLYMYSIKAAAPVTL